MEGMENRTSGIAKPQEGKMKEQMLGSEKLMEAKKKEIMSCRPKPMDGIEKENRLGSAKPKEGKEKEQMSDNAKEQGMKNEGALGSAKLMEEGDKEKKSDSTKLMDVKEKEQMSGSVKLLKVIEEQISGSVRIIDEKEKKQMTGSAKPMKDKEQISSKAQPMEGKEKEQIAGCTKSMEGKEKEQVPGSTKLLRWSIRRDSFPLVSIRNALLKRRNLSPDNLLWRRRSTGNFAAGAAGGGCGVPRSAPATPLQLEPTPRAKHEKHAFKPLSGSAPSVRVSEDAKEGKQPSKARQKKFQRHFPQVGPEERVLNYYSCALVGDLLLQGHLYITKNYFAFYSNVFGYVTKLLIPTTSVLRITKEKVARIIPNAVGVCTRDERHVFGSLLSRDSTYKLMTHVWKSARTPELVLPSKVQDLRVSEVELDASEYSPEDDSSSAGGDRLDAPEPVVRRESEAIITTAGAAVIQPALLTGGTAPKRRATHWHAMLIFFAVFLTFTAIYLAYRLYLSRFQPPEDLMKLSGEELYTELVRWRSRLHGRAAGELHSFLTTNLLLLTKVRQSLEALSGVILTDMAANAGHAPADPVFS